MHVPGNLKSRGYRAAAHRCSGHAVCKGAQPAGQSGGEIELLLSSSNLKEALFLNKKSVACSRWFSESNTF